VDLENKLKNLPMIYYINLDHRTDRREWMESQFDHWGITNYHRVRASKYDSSKYDEWKDIVVEKEILECKSLMSTALNNIETIINWYDCNLSETCIMMEDDLSLHNIKYWNFDWTYFMNNLPENWDCVQLYFCYPYQSHGLSFPMFLHKRNNSFSAAAYLINRSYAKRVKDLMYRDGKYRLTFVDNSFHKKHSQVDIIQDANLFDIGITYSVPLFNLNINLDGDNQQNNNSMHPMDIICSKLIGHWWKNKHHKFLLEDFFTYGKPNDWEMTMNVKLKNIKNFIEKRSHNTL
jgi:hypothetical protein